MYLRLIPTKYLFTSSFFENHTFFKKNKLVSLCPKQVHRDIFHQMLGSSVILGGDRVLGIARARYEENMKHGRGGASPIAQPVKNLPAVWETQEMWVGALGWEYSPGGGNSNHSSILAWKILWTEEPGRLQLMRSQRIGHDWTTKHPQKGEERILPLIYSSLSFSLYSL